MDYLQDHLPRWTRKTFSSGSAMTCLSPFGCWYKFVGRQQFFTRERNIFANLTNIVIKFPLMRFCPRLIRLLGVRAIPSRHHRFFSSYCIEESKEYTAFIARNKEKSTIRWNNYRRYRFSSDWFLYKGGSDSPSNFVRFVLYEAAFGCSGKVTGRDGSVFGRRERWNFFNESSFEDGVYDDVGNL